METNNPKFEELSRLLNQMVDDAKEEGDKQYKEFLVWLMEEGSDRMQCLFKRHTSLIAFTESLVMGKHFPGVPPLSSGKLAWEAFTPLVGIGYYMGVLEAKREAEDAEVKRLLEK